MINLFTLGLNQMIAMAEQMQRLESELLRMYLHNLSSVTERAGELTEEGSKQIRQKLLGETRSSESYARAAQSSHRPSALRHSPGQRHEKPGAPSMESKQGTKRRRGRGQKS